MFDPVKLRWLSGKAHRAHAAGRTRRRRPPVRRRRPLRLDDRPLAAAVAATRTHLAYVRRHQRAARAFFPDEYRRPQIATARRAARRTPASCRVSTWTRTALKDAIQASVARRVRRAATCTNRCGAHSPAANTDRRSPPCCTCRAGNVRALQRLDAERRTILRVLIFDPFAGISGDMTSPRWSTWASTERGCRSFVAGLGIGGVESRIERVTPPRHRGAHISFTYPPERAHRHLRHVVEIIDRRAAHRNRRRRGPTRSGASPRPRRACTGPPSRRCTSTRSAPWTPSSTCCASWPAWRARLRRFRTRPVAVGSGWIEIEHGRYPVPAPATLGILEGHAVTGPSSTANARRRPAPRSCHAHRRRAARPPIHRRPQRLRRRHPRPARPAERAARHRGHWMTQRSPLWLVQADSTTCPEYAAAAQDSAARAGAARRRHAARLHEEGPARHAHRSPCAGRSLIDIERCPVPRDLHHRLRRWPVQRATILDAQCRGRGLARPDDPLEARHPARRLDREKPEFDDVVRAAAALGLSPYEVRLATRHVRPLDDPFPLGRMLLAPRRLRNPGERDTWNRRSAVPAASRRSRHRAGLPRVRPPARDPDPCARHPDAAPTASASSAVTPSATSAIPTTSVHHACPDHRAVPVIEGWAQIYTTSDTVEADLIKENLQSEGVDAAVLSQKDRSFNVDLGDLSPSGSSSPPTSTSTPSTCSPPTWTPGEVTCSRARRAARRSRRATCRVPLPCGAPLPGARVERTPD
jgi:hypothetical protein